MIYLELPVSPSAWAAPRLSRKYTYDPKYQEKQATKILLKSLYRDSPIQGAVIVDFFFCVSVPKSASKKTKEKMLTNEIIPTKFDCTNAQKLYEDCIKNILITDDRNVKKISSEKAFAEKEKVIIKVFTIEEYRKMKCT